MKTVKYLVIVFLFIGKIYGQDLCGTPNPENPIIGNPLIEFTPVFIPVFVHVILFSDGSGDVYNYCSCLKKPTH